MVNLFGILLPPFIDLINRKVKDSDARFWVSVGVCILIGAVVNYFANGYHFNWATIEGNIIAVFGWAQLAYKGIYEDSRLQEVIRG